jgi:thiosulfate reductase cytochrome b subunit
MMLVAAEKKSQIAGRYYYRHHLPVRIMHWINVVCIAVLLMSGLGIFNAHPRLYWGNSSYTGRSPLLAIYAENGKGILQIDGHRFDTTGVLGISTHSDGRLNENAFPSWITIPSSYSLANSRAWHFFFAWLFVINGVLYIGYSLLSRHLQKDLAPDQRDLRGIGQSIKDHLLFKHPHGEEAKRYNVLQKLTYLGVILLLLPLIIVMGMAMSPMLDSAILGWVNWFGGRQAARTIHFIAAWLIVAFVFIHVFEVVISGLWNHMRSMITGYFEIESAEPKRD